jgi:chemotaxis protein methyltransferase CheR
MLDGFCQITISRFFRDRSLFEWIKTEALPRIAKTRKTIRCWCIGGASGEEPYSLSIIFHEIAKNFKDIEWEIMATDINDQVLKRAKEACYHASSLKEVSSERRDKAFDTVQDLYCLKDKFKENVVFLKQDIRSGVPDIIFDLVLCRNTVAIYFDHDQQVKIFRKALDRMNENSCIILGAHEELPEIFLEEGLVEKPVGSLPVYFKSH